MKKSLWRLHHLVVAAQVVDGRARFLHQLFRFLDHVEKEVGGVEVDALLRVLHVVKHAVAEAAELFAQGLAVVLVRLDVLAAVGAKAFRDLADEEHVFVAKRAEAFGIMFIDRHEVVVHVFERRIVDAHQSRKHLAEVVVDEVEGRAQAQAHHVVGATQAERFAATEILEHLFVGFEVALHAAHGAARFGEETIGRFHQVLCEEIEFFGRADGEVFAEHLVDRIFVFARHNALEERVARLFILLFLGKLDLRVDYQAQGQNHEGEDDDDTAEVHRQSHDEGCAKGCARRQEPSTDYAQYTRHAEYGTFACPSAVGQRRTHGHHEGDEGRGKRKFQGRAEGDEERRHAEVDGGTNEVVGRASIFRVFGNGGEATVEPVAQTAGRGVGNGGNHSRREAHEATGRYARTEEFFALLLGGKSDLRLRDALRLFGGHQGKDHDSTSGNEEIEGRFGTRFEARHHKARDVATAMGREVEEGREARKRNPDEVYQVVARKGHGQGEGADHHNDFENIHLQEV